MVAYSLFFLLIMLIVGGIGVDFMHLEMKRTRLQNTLDRAVLAAADMQNPLDPAEVVQDYLNKADVQATLLAMPAVDSGLNFRDVQASATLQVPTQFIHMIGFDHLTAPALARAEEKIEAVEIALVLDISNSMNTNNRLVNLKPAAREFIDTVMGLTEVGDVSVSIIPYNTQVSAGPDLLQHYQASGEHDFSHCVNFASDDFIESAIPTNKNLQQTMHFDMFNYAQGTSWPPTADMMPTPICNTDANADIMVMSVDGIALKNRIDSLVADGNTSIDIGMKWAANLLDPASRPVITQMIADGDVSPLNAGKPLDYDAQDSLKVIVVMTDGQNTNQYTFPDSLRGKKSDVYFDPAQMRYSIRKSNRPGGNKYYWPATNTWNPKPHGWIDFVDANDNGDDDNVEIGVTLSPPVLRLTYAELMALNSVAQNAWYNFGAMEASLTPLNPNAGYNLAWNDWYTNFPEAVAGPEKDTRLQNICDTVKADDVVVFSIGFEATANGNSQLSDCASTPSHFYPATGVNISDVFKTIAVSIAQLRLTQ